MIGTTDVWESWETTNVANYLRSNGTLYTRICSCGRNVGAATSSPMTASDLTLTLGGTTPPVADFSGTPTSGNPPLTVNFTDASTNTPTAWSWDFGDGGVSTAQNPSHTYTIGRHLHGRPDGDQRGRQQHLHEDRLHHRWRRVLSHQSSRCGYCTLASGTLADLTADDGVYMVYNSGTDADKAMDVEHVFTTAYTPSQVSKIKVEWNLKSSQADSPPVGMQSLRADGSAYDTSLPPRSSGPATCG